VLKQKPGQCHLPTPIILAIQEDEIWRIAAQGQPKQVVGETPISKIIRVKWIKGVA
jgi:hypothetical protein